MKIPRRVRASKLGAYTPALIDANGPRQTSGPNSPSLGSPREAAGSIRLQTYREAHLETEGAGRRPPTGAKVPAVGRFFAQVAADENASRRSASRSRHLAGAEYLTDRDRHLLAGLDDLNWGALVAAARNARIVTTRPTLVVGPFGSGGTGFGGQQLGGSAAGLVPNFSSRGIDLSGQPSGHNVGNFNPYPQNSPSGFPAAGIAGGWLSPVPTTYERGAYDLARYTEGELAKGPSVGDHEAWDLKQRLIQAGNDVTSEDGYDYDKEQEDRENAETAEPPELPPNPYGSNPNPDDPGSGGGWGVGGPRARPEDSRGLTFGNEATPNLEGTAGSGPGGPRARGASIGYGGVGREATPNLEGTGGTGPVGPRSRGSSSSSRLGGLYMPNPDDVTSPVGPRS
jgi:hypothetical protein